MKDAVATMGSILPDDAGGRDAVHVAVIAVVAREKLLPGQDVGAFDEEGGQYVADPKAKHVGIVDPFLKGIVFPEQRFWLYLYPRTITGLNHQWSHPDFPSVPPPSQPLTSEQWLRKFCEGADCPGYDDVMKLIRDGDYSSEDGYFNARYEHEYLHFGGRDAHGEIPAEFWMHAENVLGRKIEKRPAYFSCSC